MPVTSKHELYSEFEEDWEEVRDCVKGNRAIKRKREKYLPMLSGQTAKGYESYLTRVKFFGATGRTLDGLHGNVFRKASEQTIDVSTTFTESLKDVDLMGTNIEQFASNIIYDTLATNWGGILVDYARGEEAVSLADAENKGLKWYLKYYPAENVINWETKTINGKTQLSLVVIAEHYSEPLPNDRFTVKKYLKYRVLYIDAVTKKYRQDIYDEKISLEIPSEKEIIIKMNGEEMDEIPFYTIPGNIPEKSILYDLAQLNLQHYQDSADYQHGKHFTAIPTLAAIGLRPLMDETKNPPEPKPMPIGGDLIHYFPNEEQTPGTDVKYVEFTGQGMKALIDGIVHLESLMAITGAHIIAAEKKGVETAEALRIHRIGENGVLSAFTRNVSNSLTLALRKKGEGDGEDVNKLKEWAINFNTDYDMSEENVQTLTMLLTGRSNGEIPRISVYLGLKALNLIPEQWDYETFLTELEKDKQDTLPEIDDTESKEPDEDDSEEDDPEEPESNSEEKKKKSGKNKKDDE